MVTQQYQNKKNEVANFTDARNVLTTDARKIGQMTGIIFDGSNWTVHTVIVKLEKAILDELNIKKPIFRTPSVSIPVSLVSSISDVVQLNTDFSGMMGIIAPMNP